MDNKEIIVTFHLAHDAILGVLVQVQSVRAYPQARRNLRELQEQIFPHLKRQDEILKRLAAHYAGQRDQSKIIEFLVYELKELRIKSLIFFDTYETAAGEVAARNFSKEFLEFSRAVVNRLKMEEDYLLPLLPGLPAEEKP